MGGPDRFVLQLASKLKTVRDGYSTTVAQRQDLYLLLKARPQYKTASHFTHKLGANNVAWLEGLERYGDSKGWLEPALARQARRMQKAERRD